MTAKGGEGMVVKPFDFIPTGRRGLAQPAVKCRGREYLRIIYGPEIDCFTESRSSQIARTEREGMFAMREFALGIEALESLVAL